MISKTSKSVAVVAALALSQGRATRGPAIQVVDAAAGASTASAATTTGNASRDSLIAALQSAQPVQYAMKDESGRSMDTAKIIQVANTYYAVYSPGSQSVALASSPTLYGTWTPLATLDGNSASQPYLAQMSDGSFVLADEYVTDVLGDSAINFKHYASLSTLSARQ